MQSLIVRDFVLFLVSFFSGNVYNLLPPPGVEMQGSHLPEIKGREISELPLHLLLSVSLSEVWK